MPDVVMLEGEPVGGDEVTKVGSRAWDKKRQARKQTLRHQTCRHLDLGLPRLQSCET